MLVFKSFYPRSLSSIDMSSLRAKLNHVCDMHYNFDGIPAQHPTPKRPKAPKFDVTETPTAYTIVGELPDAEKDSITVDWVDDQTLLVHGRLPVNEDTEDEEIDEKHAKHTAIPCPHQKSHDGKFERSFTLPTKVPKTTNISFVDGVLKIDILKA